MEKIIDTRFGREDIFEIVSLAELPKNYFIWNIGRQNFPHPNFIPLAKPNPNGIPYHIDSSTLKCVEMPNEEIALELLKMAGEGKVTKRRICDYLEKLNN